MAIMIGPLWETGEIPLELLATSNPVWSKSGL
jgi:hypothetical protein